MKKVIEERGRRKKERGAVAVSHIQIKSSRELKT